MAKYAYFPGCSLHSTAHEYDLSARNICKKLGIDLVEIPDWNCCGATSAHSTSHLMGVALPARTLAIANDMGLDLTAPCAACYQRFVAAYKEMQDEKTKVKICKAMEREYKGTSRVKNFLEIFTGPDMLATIRAKTTNPLKGLKVACYYGCLLVKPPQLVGGFDDPENPQSMDNLVQALGGEAVPWPYKTECCGASLFLSTDEAAIRLTNDILKIAKDSGADCIVTACPLCHQNLDMRQSTANGLFNVKYNLPVLFFTQIIGLGLGISPRQLGFKGHFVDCTHVLRKVGAA
jgi:heterodisulfide reductase subunit B